MKLIPTGHFNSSVSRTLLIEELNVAPQQCDWDVVLKQNEAYAGTIRTR